ncbi:MAG TPA: NAD(P)H-hydrate dehydratase [Verrucomicrobiae bacterium]|nr:NAD(P)H-hydrate dehydratase [Verrucomicrobiae bacterium]
MPIPVINLAQMREWENATWANGQTETEVIRRVGKKIAKRARKLTATDDLILILAGKGHNGDDARAAQEFLENRRGEILNVASPETDLLKLQEWLRQKPALVIDGLFGIGLNRELDEHWKKFITAVNESKIPVLAVDVPSGLNCETGEHFGAAIEAEITLTVGAPKIGMLAQSAWPFVGRLEVLDDVGLIPCPFAGELNWTVAKDFENFPPRRPVASHKGSFGHLAMVAGSFGFHGAAVLAAHAAQRAQPGLVTVFPHEAVYHVVAAQLQAAMVNVWKPDLKLHDGINAILVGPGLAALDLGDGIKAFMRRLWRDSELPLIADASALDWLPSHSLMKNLIRVVTPHPGEAARMLNTSTEKIQANRPLAVREISKRFGNCWVVLKGHQTLIGRSEGEIFVNSSGNPHLAQGGSGDALAGFLGGLLAQPELQKDSGKTIRYAVWQHGLAADKLQNEKRNWVVEDLIRELGNVR